MCTNACGLPFGQRAKTTYAGRVLRGQQVPCLPEQPLVKEVERKRTVSGVGNWQTYHWGYIRCKIQMPLPPSPFSGSQLTAPPANRGGVPGVLTVCSRLKTPAPSLCCLFTLQSYSALQKAPVMVHNEHSWTSVTARHCFAFSTMPST